MSVAGPSAGASDWNGCSVLAVLEMRHVPPSSFSSSAGIQRSHSCHIDEDPPIARGSVPQQVWAAHPCLSIPSRVHPELG